MPHKTNWSTVKPSPRANEQLQAPPFPSLHETPGPQKSGVSVCKISNCTATRVPRRLWGAPMPVSSL